jgi:hypothetical protein
VRLFILVRLGVDAIAVFVPDEGAALMRSVAHGFGWDRSGDRPQRFRPPTLVQVPAADPKNAAPCEVRARASGIHQSWQGLMRTIQVAEPRQMCWLPCTADMITSALEFAGGECEPPGKFTRRHRPTRLAQARLMRDGVGARPKS